MKKSSLFWRIAAAFLALYLKFCFKTSHVNFSDSDRSKLEIFYNTGCGGILAFWHGRMAFMPHLSPAPERTFVMISLHGDGSLITDIISWFKIRTIRGSTNRPSTHPKGAKNRGGRHAMAEAIKEIKNGNIFAITPDGPKGPAMKVYPGIIKIADITGVKILPVSFSTSKYIPINSWDKFLFPLPFGKVAVKVGEIKNYSAQELETELNRLTNECDNLVR